MKKHNITLSLALAAVFSSSVAFAEVEVTGKIVHESAAFSERGNTIGSRDNWMNTGEIQHGKGGMLKSETSVRVFIDGEVDEISEGASYHVELNGFHDSEALKNYGSNQEYTQRDALREAYIDMEKGDFSIRAGKQQVVWGTADGMKLLDAINPTDFSEMAQNQMEDSRIPVWMINAETEAASGGSFQFIISEAKGNKIAGLGNTIARGTTHDDASSDQGHAFMMKGPDLITGQVNGMMNIGPALGRAARAFGTYVGASANLAGATATVADFADTAKASTGFEAVCDNTRGASNANTSDAICLYKISNRGTAEKQSVTGAAGNNDKYNILDASTSNASYDASNPNSMFEYLDQTQFGTFDTFVDMTSEYRVEEPDGINTGFRFKDATANGLNYSLNYLYGDDANPYVDFHWEMDDGTRLYEVEDSGDNYMVRLCTTTDCGGGTVAAGSGDVGKYASTDSEYANAVFTERHAKIHNIGGSFDMAIETIGVGPVVLRGEALYQKDVMTTVIVRKDEHNLNAQGLQRGFFDSAFTNQKADFFKYVIGADITALTNMMVSAQFIQTLNLDYVNLGNKDEGIWKYTADTAVMSLDNNMQKAKSMKEFYSLFLSKPFGASGEHRWNNIFMYEDGDGKWNRFDAELSINDDVQATVEINSYFGDKNTQFGQLSASSNIQVGVKYSF